MNGCEHYKVGQGQSSASDSQLVSMFRYLYNAKFTLHDFSPKLGEDFFFLQSHLQTRCIHFGIYTDHEDYITMKKGQGFFSCKSYSSSKG